MDSARRDRTIGSASTGMLIVPVIGVVSAALILGEPLGLREWAAMASRSAV